jgi:hypothetical protein
VTRQQAKLLAFLRDNPPPVGASYDEMAAAIGSGSRGYLHTLVDKLIRAGLAYRGPGHTRNVFAVPVNPLASISTDDLFAELRRRNPTPFAEPARSRDGAAVCLPSRGGSETVARVHDGASNP